MDMGVLKISRDNAFRAFHVIWSVNPGWWLLLLHLVRRDHQPPPSWKAGSMISFSPSEHFTGSWLLSKLSTRSSSCWRALSWLTLSQKLSLSPIAAVILFPESLQPSTYAAMLCKCTSLFLSLLQKRPLLTRNIYAFGKDPWVNLVPDKNLNETLEQKDL